MHSILFHLFGRSVYAYGFLLGLGVIAGWFLSFRLAARDGMPVARLKGITVLAILGALFFARALYLLTNPGLWHGVWSLFDLEGGGLVAYGGLLGGLLVGYLGCRLARLDFLRFMDHVAPALAFGLMFARLGCLMNGCDFGQVCELPWAVSFPAGNLAFEHHVALGWISAGASHSLPVHPTQLYAAGFGLLLGAGLLWGHTCLRGRFHGLLFLIFLAAYPLFRFGVELLRDDPGRGALGALSTSQVISLGVLVAVAVVGIRRWRAAASS